MHRFRKQIIYYLPLVVLSVASYASAQTGGSTLNSPLNSAISTIPALIAGALKALIIIALPIISLFFVYTGFLFVKARGNSGELTTAKRAFFYVMIGAVLILSAWLFANLLGNTVSQLLPTQ